MTDPDKTQKLPNPALAKTVRIDPSEFETPSRGDVGRKTVVMHRPPEISAVAWLVANRGDERGKMHRIDGEKVVVGADSRCEIVIGHDHVSDQHASIRFNDGSFTITDLDTTNGTTINGKDAHQEALADGDQVGFGSSQWVFKCVVFQDS